MLICSLFAAPGPESAFVLVPSHLSFVPTASGASSTKLLTLENKSRFDAHWRLAIDDEVRFELKKFDQMIQQSIFAVHWRCTVYIRRDQRND
jgi:hypothetical protein